jgi:hypothetical protein
MDDLRRTKVTAAAAIAAGGVLIGHWLAYVVAVPHPRAREGLLAVTGHAYLPGAAKLVLVALVIALGALFWGALQHRDPRAFSFVRVASKLAFLQVVAFSAMEMLERVGSHVPVGELFSHRLFLLGVLAQVLTALLGALVLAWVMKSVLVARLARSEAGEPPRPGFSFQVPASAGVLRSADIRLTNGARAPPATSLY